MAILIERDENGNKIYRGFLSSEETKKADLLLGFLQDEIPRIGLQLSEAYGDGVLYKYFLGKKLGELLDKYGIEDKQRVYFWNEIKNFASEKERKRNEGGDSKTRKFYEQCYRLSQLEQETVEKLSWRQWQDLLDRTKNREDERIFNWIKTHEPKIKEAEWRGFEKGLNLFLDNKDTSVFEDEELFEVYEFILMMAQEWLSCFSTFSKEHPKSAKIKSKTKWEKKYYELCFKCRKANKRILDADECRVLFETLMNP